MTELNPCSPPVRHATRILLLHFAEQLNSAE